MLDPDDRHLLVEALKPPPEMTLDIAVGTTFTLDLQALLVAPVSFALFSATAPGGESDSLALLEAVRRHADRITIFCQAGCIAVPRTLQPVLAWLEDSVVPVAPPRPGRLFHPKVWVLRFRNDAGEYAHRVLVASRNLTFDSSWDTIVCLDEDPAATESDDNEPLRLFLDELSAGAVQRPTDDRQQQISDLVESLRDVKWELPDGALEVRFWPLGGDHQLPDLTGDRSLVISPFLSGDTLQRLSSGGDRHLLVSRADALNSVGSLPLDGFEETFVLDTDAVEDSDDEPEAEQERVGIPLRGLHAKLFLVERGRRCHLYTGSANATGAGFGGNTELLVELVGRRNQWGIDQVLDAKGHKATLRDLLRPFRPENEEPAEPDELATLTYRLDSLVQQIASIPFTVTVSPTDTDHQIHIATQQPMPAVNEGTTVTIRLASVAVTAEADGGISPGQAVDVDAGVVTLAGVTSFLVVTATASVEGRRARSAALINARLVGAPDDRKERLLSAQLKDSDDLIRYLLFLLFDLVDDARLDQLLSTFGGAGGRWRHSGQIPLLETMLRALVRGGSALDRVADLLDDLPSTDREELLPEGLEEIWEPINAVRQELRA